MTMVPTFGIMEKLNFTKSEGPVIYDGQIGEVASRILQDTNFAHKKKIEIRYIIYFKVFVHDHIP